MPIARSPQRILALAAGEAARIEAKFSRYRRGNVIDAVNTADGRTVVVDEETARLLDYAQQLFELSDGKFDVTSGVLRRAWRFDGSDRVPSRKAVAALLPIVGWDKVRWQAPELTLLPGMEIDLGGIGKEYAVDRAAALVRPLSTHCLFNFGGDLLGARTASRRARRGASVSNRSPVALRRRSHIELERGALATSGDARRYLLKDGKRYGHILDPTTGWPVVDAPRSVSVAATYLHARRNAGDFRFAARPRCGGVPRRAGRAVLVATLKAIPACRSPSARRHFLGARHANIKCSSGYLAHLGDRFVTPHFRTIQKERLKGFITRDTQRKPQIVRRLSRSIAPKRNFLAVCLTVKSLDCSSLTHKNKYLAGPERQLSVSDGLLTSARVLYTSPRPPDRRVPRSARTRGRGDGPTAASMWLAP